MAATAGTELQAPRYRGIQAQNTQQDNALLSGIKEIGRCIASFFQYLWDNCCCCIPCGHRQSRVLENVAPVMPGPGGGAERDREEVEGESSEATESEIREPAPFLPRERRAPLDRGIGFTRPHPLLRHAFLSDQRREPDETTSGLLQATEHLAGSDRLVAFARDALRNPEVASSRRVELENILQEAGNNNRGNGLYSAILDGRGYFIRNHARQFLERLVQSGGDEEDADDLESLTSVRTVIHRPSAWADHAEPQPIGATGYTPPGAVARRMMDIDEPVFLAHGPDRIRDSDRRLDRYHALIEFARAISHDRWGERTDFLFRRTGLRQNATNQAIEQVLPQLLRQTPFDMARSQVRNLVNIYEQGRGRRRTDRDLDTMLIAALVISDYTGVGSRSTSVETSRRSSLAEESDLEDSPLTEDEDALPSNGPTTGERRDWGGARPRTSTAVPAREPLSGSREDYTTNGVYLGATHMPSDELARLASSRRTDSESVLRTVDRVSGDASPRAVRLAELLIRQEYEEATALCRDNPNGDQAYQLLRQEFYLTKNRHMARRLAMSIVAEEREDESSPYASLRESYRRNEHSAREIIDEYSLATFLDTRTRSRNARAATETETETIATEAEPTETPEEPPECAMCFSNPGTVEWSCCSIAQNERVAFCPECIDGTISVELDADKFDDYLANNQTIRCQTCRARVELGPYANYLTQETQDKLFEFAQRVLNEGAGTYFVKCTACSNGGTVDSSYREPYFECTQIERHPDRRPRRVCVSCSNIWEGRQHECPQSPEAVLLNKIESMHLAISNPDNVKLCPNETCLRRIERQSGCNEMNCDKCRRNFCWNCMDNFMGTNGCYERTAEAHHRYHEAQRRGEVVANPPRYFYGCTVSEDNARSRRVGAYRTRLVPLVAEYRRMTGRGNDDSITIDVLANQTGNVRLNSAQIVDSRGNALNGRGTVSVVNNQLQFAPGTDFDCMVRGESTSVTVRYDMSDDQGRRSEGTTTIRVAGTNDYPVATADTATTSIDVLANQTDNVRVDRAQIVDCRGNPLTGQGTVRVVNNQLQFTLGSDFDNMANGESTTVNIRYVMSNNQGRASEATATIRVNGTRHFPVATADTATITIDVLANQTDNVRVHSAQIVDNRGNPLLNGQGTVRVVSNRLEFMLGSDFDNMANGESTTVNIRYVMTNNQGRASEATVRIRVNGTRHFPEATVTTGTSS